MTTTVSRPDVRIQPPVRPHRSRERWIRRAPLLPALIFAIVLGLGLALLLDRSFVGRPIVRTLLITPFLVMPIAAALLWKHAIFNPAAGVIVVLLTIIVATFALRVISSLFRIEEHR